MRFSPILSFEGRASRFELWVMLSSFSLLWLAAEFASWTTHMPEISITCAWLVMVPTLALFVKRMHDRGRSARWLLLGIIPGFGWAWVITELVVMRGDRHDNIYGQDPLYDLDWRNIPA